ncbi:hypothetical protein [Kineobactrum sediminis]|uniref:hypothetical protein n=1 Tax=Kineobactrum sediminis TaxID=1905677 RepID=UPI0012D70B4B|nr:hypothetical protein [Kineobactrum sediminis]
MLEVIVGSEDRTLEELLQAERAAVQKTLNTPDHQEGMTAFLEKRKPAFNRAQ